MTPNPMNMQMMGLMTGPPDVQAGASDLFQRMELAKMLRQNAMEPIKADQYASAGGGQYAAPQQIVKVGWGQGLAKLGQGLLAGMQGQKDRDELKALSEKLRGAQTGEMERLFGAPEQESGQMYPAGGNPDEVGGMGYKPATSGVPQKDLARALAGSWMPEFQKTGLEMLTKPPVKEQRTVVPAGSVVLDAEGKPVFTAPQKTQFENATTLSKLLAERDEIAKANPSDVRLKAYDNAIRKESETAKQIVPSVTVAAPEQPPVAVVGPAGTPILVSRAEAIKNRMTPVNLDAASQANIAEAKKTGQSRAETAISAQKDKTSAIKALRDAGYDPLSGKDKVSELLDKATGGALGKSLDTVAGAFNLTTEGKAANASLEALANTIVMQMMGGKLGAGISNADREFITGQLGKVGDPNEPVGARKAAWNTAKQRLISVGVPMTPDAGVASATKVDQIPGAAKTVVREVQLKDGRIGVEYSDGSRGYK